MAVPSLQLVKATEPASPETAKWDPELTKRVVGFLRPIAKRYFRSEIRDLGRIPAGGALLVSNHSGGPTTTDLPTFAVDFYDRFGYDRPLYTLSHDILSVGPAKQFLQQLGFIPASRDNAAHALASDAAVMVFPGATSTRCGQLWRKTSSTSTAGPATYARPSKPVCRSCP